MINLLISLYHYYNYYKSKLIYCINKFNNVFLSKIGIPIDFIDILAIRFTVFSDWIF